MDISDFTNEKPPKDLKAEKNITPKYTKEALIELESCVETVKRAVEDNGLSMEEFHKLRVKNADLLSDIEADKMIAIREAIEMPTENTIMQKAVCKADYEKYLNGRFAINGFATRAQDTKNLNSYMDFYDCLRLDYDTSKFLPETDNSLYLIRFKTVEADNADIPYNKCMKGKRDYKPPTTGNGFTAAENDEIIPEYRFSAPVFPQNGSEIYEITRDGKEILRAVFDEDSNEFIPILTSKE